jgi:hypothetical protein
MVMMFLQIEIQNEVNIETHEDIDTYPLFTHLNNLNLLFIHLINL